MALQIEIRPLQRGDDRGSFTCGQEDLDRFFRHYAGQNQFNLHLAVTCVAILEGFLAGFATVSVSGLERSRVPQQSLRRRLLAYPLPVLRLARLGVDTRAHGRGVGTALLRHVLHVACQQSDSLGCVGVVTDAKPEATAFYKAFGFVSLEGVREGTLHGDPTPMFLPIKTILRALDSAEKTGG